MPDTAFAGEQIVALDTADDDVLRVEHVAKRFGPTTALRDINLHLRKGEVLALLGDNGAGKSTLDQDPVGLSQEGFGIDVVQRRALRATVSGAGSQARGSTPSFRIWR